MAWSSDGSKLLIQSYEHAQVSVPRPPLRPQRGRHRDDLGHERRPACSSGSWSLRQSEVRSPPTEHRSSTQPRRKTTGDRPSTSSTRRGAHRECSSPAAVAGCLSNGKQRTAPGYTNPTYSPDGTQIAYFDAACSTAASQLRVMNADGTGVRILLERPEVPSCLQPRLVTRWGTARVRRRIPGSGGIFVVGADGSGLTLVDPRWGGSVLVIGRHPHRVSHPASTSAPRRLPAVRCSARSRSRLWTGRMSSGSAPQSPGRGIRSFSRDLRERTSACRQPELRGVGGPARPRRGTLPASVGALGGPRASMDRASRG